MESRGVEESIPGMPEPGPKVSVPIPEPPRPEPPLPVPPGAPVPGHPDPGEFGRPVPGVAGESYGLDHRVSRPLALSSEEPPRPGAGRIPVPAPPAVESQNGLLQAVSEPGEPGGAADAPLAGVVTAACGAAREAAARAARAAMVLRFRIGFGMVSSFFPNGGE